MIFFNPQAVPPCSVLPLPASSGARRGRGDLYLKSSFIYLPILNFLAVFRHYINKQGNLKKKHPKFVREVQNISHASSGLFVLAGRAVAKGAFPKHVHAGTACWASRHACAWLPWLGHLLR